MFLRGVFAVLFVFFLMNLAGPTLAVAQIFSSSNLPIIVVETPPLTYIPDEPKLEAHMGIIYNGAGARNNLSDPFNDFDGKIGIELRGSSSRMFPKSQYGFDVRTAAGADTSVSLLGLPPEEDWILFAPYNDKSLMRDVLAYKMGRDLGRYAPRTRYCELVIDGQYQGVYVLIEKIKRDRSRVNIAKLEPDETSDDDISGGYILKIDKFSGDGGSGFSSQYPPDGATGGQQTFFQFDYPEPEVISTEQRNYIRQFVQTFESVLITAGYDNPFQGYRAYADVESFVDFMIMNEVSKNVDGYRLSTYLHKQKNTDGGKLVMGPIWDFNLGYGNANYCTSGEPEGFVYNFNSVCPDDFWLVPFWWKKLLRDTYFKKTLQSRWKELRTGKFSTPVIHAYIDSVATELNLESQQRNFEKWPVLDTWIWPNLYLANTFQGEVDILKWWVQQRMNWLDMQWGEDFVTDAADEEETMISVYPNPSATEWRVELGVPVQNGYRFEVTDLGGRSFVSRTLDEGAKSFIVSGEGLADGLYVLRIDYGPGHTTVHKLVKASGIKGP
jgi:hypothetical protein